MSHFSPSYKPFVILYLVLHFSEAWKCGEVWQSKDNVTLFSWSRNPLSVWGGGGDRGSQSPASRTPFSRLPCFFVLLSPNSRPLSCFSRYHVNHAVWLPILIGSVLALSKIKKCVVNQTTFLRHKFTPRDKTFSFLWIIVVRREFPGRSSMDGFSISPPHRKIPRPIKMVFDDIWPDSLCRSGEGKRRNEFEEWHVAWLAEWHNYVECKLNIRRMTQRNKLNWKVRHFLAPINLQTQPLF